jgi:hypothetical protein
MSRSVARRDFKQPVPVLYQQMCTAIEAAHRVDEVKDIRDVAVAWEVYCQQAKNTQAEIKACEIRLRAERKAGQLLARMEKAKGGGERGVGRRGGMRSTGTTTLKDLGITKDQSAKWQKLGSIPEEVFEMSLADATKKASTIGIIREADPVRKEIAKIASVASWFWFQCLFGFEQRILDKNLTVDDVLRTMTPDMLDDVHTIAPRVAKWLEGIGRAKHG